MPAPIFNNSHLQNNFDANGYVVLDLLAPETVEQLKAIYANHTGLHHGTSFVSTNLLDEKTVRFEIAEAIKQVIQNPLSRFFVNTKFWAPALMIKPPGEATEFKLHQDWTFVDEEQFYSGNVWVPLSDTDVNNGTICVIPQSHYRFIKTLRAHTIHEIFRNRETVIKDLCIPVNLKAGQAIVFQHSAVHYSPPNLSDSNRVAVSCGFNSENATLITYHKTSDDKVEVYAVPDNFVFNYENLSQLGAAPQNGTLLRTESYKPHAQLSNTELRNLFLGR